MKEKKRSGLNLLTLTVVLGFVFSCGGSGGGDKGGGNSDPVDTTPTPVANAGPDQALLAGTLVSLDGSGSINAETYAWSFTSKPAGIIPILSSKTLSNPTFTAVVPGDELSLIVSNGAKSSPPDTVTITSVNPARVPDTGQKKCYDTIGIYTLCAESGQDAAYNAVNQPSYTSNGNDTITDNVTGLMWQKCTLGRRGDTCTVGTLLYYDWYAATGTADPVYNPGGATNACGDLTLAGHSDWRLPTEAELMTLVDYSGFYIRVINNNYFPGTQTSLYWASESRNGFLNGFVSGQY